MFSHYNVILAFIYFLLSSKVPLRIFPKWYRKKFRKFLSKEVTNQYYFWNICQCQGHLFDHPSFAGSLRSFHDVAEICLEYTRLIIFNNKYIQEKFLILSYYLSKVARFNYTPRNNHTKKVLKTTKSKYNLI